MPAQSKIDMLEKVNAALDASDGVYVIDYQGLSVKESQELRRNLTQYHRPDLPVRAIGSVAYYFSEQLVFAAAEEGFAIDKVAKSPMQGLISYYNF